MADAPVAPHKQRAHFPFINLKKALERAEQLYKADPAGRQMAITSAFEVWEYSLKSSGGHQTIAALRSYGLLDADGNLESRKVSLSAKALHYFKDERPEERLKLLQEFALKPKLFNQLWHGSQWRASPPADSIARSHLKIEKGLNEQAARAILGTYKDNLTLAKLKGDATIPESADGGDDTGGGADKDPPPPSPVKVGDFIQWTSSGVDQFPSPRRVDWVSDDRQYLRVFGSPTGIPMNEAIIAEAGKPPTIPLVTPNTPPFAGATKSDDISVYLVRDRLQITADVDAAGLEKLKDVLEKYTEILKLMS
jgi:hypothetical protein